MTAKELEKLVEGLKTHLWGGDREEQPAPAVRRSLTEAQGNEIIGLLGSILRTLEGIEERLNSRE